MQWECGMWFETSYRVLMHSHAEHHVAVSSVDLQQVVWLKRDKCRVKIKNSIFERLLRWQAHKVNKFKSSRWRYALWWQWKCIMKFSLKTTSFILKKKRKDIPRGHRLWLVYPEKLLPSLCPRWLMMWQAVCDPCRHAATPLSANKTRAIYWWMKTSTQSQTNKLLNWAIYITK